MDCEITKGRTEPCKDSVGGVKALYFGNYGTVRYSIDAGTEEVVDIDDGVASTPATLYKWEVRTSTNLEETVNGSRENGTTFWAQVLNATFKKLDATTRKELKMIAYGRPYVIIHDYNGNALLCGYENGMDVTGGTVVTGSAMGDLSGYTLVMTGEERESALMLKGATQTDPFAGMATTPTIVTATAGTYAMGGGACAAGSVNGSFNAGVALTSSNYLEVDISVTELGSWSIDTDSVNGYRVSGQGVFSSTGTQTVRLYGEGTPALAQTDTFTLSSNDVTGTGICTQDVTVAA